MAATLGLAGCVPSRSGDGAQAGAPLMIGSKQFTESVVLGELATALVRASGSAAEHRSQLGGTQVLWNALVRGEIDVYPEYTGTLEQEILKGEGVKGQAELRRALASYGVVMSRPLGFNDTYALGMKAARAKTLGIRSISDLNQHPELRFGFTNEFMDRADGWPGLKARYALPQQDVRGLDHDLAYRGLDADTIDVTDLYSTDADISYYDIRVLQDDLNYFPVYDAVWLMRADLKARAPAAVAALSRLEGKVDARTMAAMNARAKIQQVPESRIAKDFLAMNLGLTVIAEEPGRGARILRRTEEHLGLVGVSLSAALCVALPLGVLSARRPRLGAVLLGATGVLQTIPSLALLVFMIPLLGIGAPPAVAALFLYSLLPIVRNTHTGLTGIPAPLRESAEALGLSPRACLWHVELPLASPSILAGIKTSAVINVGTATLGAVIGAGGYGQPILTGIRLDNVGLILEGAVPAALLAVAVQGLFAEVERWVVPLGLRLARKD
ncbi:MAG TPA: glycine betaine ABC transporter substrate-binding protein [Myxococcota bacterium]|nr:glycine betaine ABC transporter substrate-binding protein [Myxococcota bacterium]